MSVSGTTLDIKNDLIVHGYTRHIISKHPMFNYDIIQYIGKFYYSDLIINENETVKLDYDKSHFYNNIIINSNGSITTDKPVNGQGTLILNVLDKLVLTSGSVINLDGIRTYSASMWFTNQVNACHLKINANEVDIQQNAIISCKGSKHSRQAKIGFGGNVFIKCNKFTNNGFIKTESIKEPEICSGKIIIRCGNIVTQGTISPSKNVTIKNIN